MKFKFNDKEYYIDGFLAQNLNSIVYNIKNDWDFIILITGDRTVRVGKSVLGMTVCAYLSQALKKVGINSPYDLSNVFFDSKKMVSYGLKAPKHSIIHYDEGREGLAASKYAKDMQQDLLDFFAECGQLNHIFVIVLPDFFELAESVAVPRSEILLNVYRKSVPGQVNLFGEGPIDVVKFDRGRFEFFNRKKKQALYEKSKVMRRKSYSIIKCNFYGMFTDQWPIDKQKYIDEKREALSRFMEKKEKEERAKARRKDLTAKQKLLLHSVLKNMDRSELRSICIDIGVDPAYGTQIIREWPKRHGLKQDGDE